MNTHVALATREGRWWIVEVEGVGTTQARNLTEAREMAVDLISITENVPAVSVAVELRIALETDLETEIAEARAAIKDLEERQLSVARTSRSVARKLVKSAGLTGRDAAVVLGVSPQRVSQLLAE